MIKENLNDLAAFVAVANEQSFTRAAAKLGVSPSALSHTVRHLEERLGLKLLSRTTRSVAPTQAGQHLLMRVGPHLAGIHTELTAMTAFRAKPAGLVRINAGEHAATTILSPKLAPLLAEYEDIKVEIAVDNGLTDIVAQNFDAGVRFGEQLDKDMVAVRIGPNISMAVVAAPSLFARKQPPKTPQDLLHHRCINMRLPTRGGLYAWEFEKGNKEIKVKVSGPCVFNQVSLILDAALAGIGIAYLPEDLVAPHLATGRLTRVLQDWCAPFPGYYLYYCGRKHLTPAFALVVQALRYVNK